VNIVLVIIIFCSQAQSHRL